MPSHEPAFLRFPSRIRALLFLSVAILSGSAVTQAAVQPWTSNTGCQAGIDFQSQVTFGDSAVFCTDTSSPLPGVTYIQSASGSTTVSAPTVVGSLIPVDLTAASSAAALILSDPDVSPGSISSAGAATATVYFWILPTAVPPTAAPFVGLQFRVTGMASKSGEGATSGAGAWLLLPSGPQVLLFHTDQFPPGTQNTVGSTHLVPVGQPYALRKSANCTAAASARSPSSSCSAQVDPAITFDQAGFDALMGASTFPLADYFRLEYSPNLTLDRDGDGLVNAADNCAYYTNPGQADTDGDHRGDACECTDQNGDGRNTVSDLVAINTAIFNPTLATPLCDGNNDGLCNVSDIIAANVEIFSPGNTSTCARQPAPGP